MFPRRVFAVAIFVAAIVSGNVQPARAEPHVLRYADGLDLTGLNPLRPEAAPNYELNFLTMAYLSRYGKGGRLVPELLAVLPTKQNGAISADGKTVRFTLRRGLTWSDGTPLTSADIAFTIAVINDPKTNSQYHDGFDQVTGVETPDETTAVVHLKAPDGSALEDFCSSRSAPLLPKHLLAGIDFNTAPYQGLPVGAGPFRYLKWERGDRVELERNPFYALGAPKLERIVFKMIPTAPGTITALRTGEIDAAIGMTYSEYKPLESDSAIHVLTAKGVRPSRFTLNVQRPVLADINVRRALRLAIDRRSMLQTSFFGAGVLAESPVTSVDPYVARIPLVPYDPAAAVALLERAGWKRGPDGVRVKNGLRLQIEIAAGAGSGFVDQILELVRTEWSAIGVAVTTKRYPLSLMFGPAEAGGIIFGGKFDVALFSNGEQNAADASSGPLCSRIPPKGTNFSRLCEPAYDTLVNRALAEYDPAVAGPMFREAQVRIAALVPTITLVLRDELYLTREGVSGVAFSPFAFFFDPLTLDVTR